MSSQDGAQVQGTQQIKADLVFNEMTSTRQMRVEITRHYQTSSITIGLTSTIMAESREDLTRAYSEMIDHLIDEHRVQLERLHGNLPQPQTGGRQAVAPSDITTPGESEEFDVEHVEIEIKGNKRYYKLLGGKYTKHGVRIWLDPSTVGAVDFINWADFTPGKHDLMAYNLKCKIGMNGDKPTKVLQVFQRGGTF